MADDDLTARIARRGDPEAVPVRFDNKALRRSVLSVLLVFLAFTVAVWLFGQLSHFLLVLLLAWLLSIAMEPGVAWLSNHGWRRGAATGLVLLTIVLVTLGFLGLFGGLFFTQLADLVQQLPAVVTDIIEWLNTTFDLKLDPNNVLELLQISPSQITLLATNLAGGVLGVFGLLFGTLFDALTMLVFAFYFSADGPRLRRAVGSWLPLESQRVFVAVWDIAVTKTGGFVVSKVILATLSSLAHSIAFFVIGVPYWLPMGVFAGVVSQFIPTIGTYIGIIVPAAFAAFEQPLDVVWIVAFATLYQQLENYVFTPRVSRVTMDIHPALALGSVFLGVALFGPIGAIIGIPLAAAALAVMDTYGKRRELIPELQVRTKGEKPARHGDAFAGDPDVVTPAGLPLSDAPAEAAAPDRVNET
ncbi:AI-2E family transporter [Longivirga aurantiaca]|uniref:AI-2E family transporter n=1 Tax=Longivirga aurantiaca TaxID=1837743 RepID=A0ABW1T4M5_9ACTN